MCCVLARERRKAGTVISTKGRNSHSYSSRVAQIPFKDYHLQRHVSLKLSTWVEEMVQSLKRLLCELGDLDSADWNPCLKSWWVGNALTSLLKQAKAETGGFLKLIGQTA